ncbi:MAG: 2,3-diphosphoglycerate synthetase [Clostridia bacterium]|nr:2,3-diphosphoglycerate synthetase [Clostridia bacterium]
MVKSIVLTDGEHYPAVTHDAIKELSTDRDIMAAVFIGGTEKIGSDADFAKIGVPVVRKPDYLEAIAEAIEQYHPDEVVDLSDEPVVGYRERFSIASVVLAHGVAYLGADFRFTPPMQATRVSRPSMSVVGTGKRIGKTAVGGFVARTLAHEFRPVVVTMGRGGPAEPELIQGTDLNITPEYLMSVSKQGRHASSDHFEDALTSRVTTIGCRRCGGGMSGQTFTSNVEKGALLSEKVDADIVVFEGSGSTIPSVHTDARILVVGAHQPIDYLRSYLGPYRVLTSNLIILTMCESPIADETKVQQMEEAIHGISPEVRMVKTIFRPRPLGDISGKRIVVTLTTPKIMADVVSGYLEKHYGCTVVGVSCSLSNRPLLRQDLARFEALKPDAVVTELKAAAVDVVTSWGLGQGYPVIYMDNEPIPISESDHLDEEVLALARKCMREFSAAR